MLSLQPSGPEGDPIGAVSALCQAYSLLSMHPCQSVHTDRMGFSTKILLVTPTWLTRSKQQMYVAGGAARLLSMRQVWPLSWLQGPACGWRYAGIGGKLFCILYERCRRGAFLLLRIERVELMLDEKDNRSVAVGQLFELGEVSMANSSAVKCRFWGVQRKPC